MISNIFRRFSSTAKVIFNDVKLNKTYPIQVPLGSNLLDIAIENNINIEHACDGQLACSTCHIVLDKADYKKIPVEDETEIDLLDLVDKLESTSRLCCQIDITKELNGLVINIPEEE